VQKRNRSGRLFDLILARDAVAVYKRAHRCHVGVLQLLHPEVCTHPEVDFALRTSKVITLRRYVQYKTYLALLLDWSRPEVWIPDFQIWLGAVGCEGEQDPRCLPLHVFKAPGDEDGLDARAARDSFDDKYGPGHNRLDTEDFSWTVKEAHGIEELHVAGSKLRKGFHWNVEPPRSSSGRSAKRIYTPTEEWEIFRYVNVAPDAHVRGRMPFARIRSTCK